MVTYLFGTIKKSVTELEDFKLHERRVFPPWRKYEFWDLREIRFGDVDWIHWAQDRDRWRALVNTVMNLRVP
jgi:hypothetical protein